MQGNIDRNVQRITSFLFWLLFFGWPVSAIAFAYLLGLAICQRRIFWVIVSVIGWRMCMAEFRNHLKL